MNAVGGADWRGRFLAWGHGMVMKLVAVGWLPVLIDILTDARGICSN